VKIQLEAAGMCHSDQQPGHGRHPRWAASPSSADMKGAGIVTEVWARGRGLAPPATTLLLSFIPSCGKCPSCQAGLRNLCDIGAGLLNGAAVSDGTFRIKAKNDTPVFPMTLLGTFSPYMVVHKSSVVKIDPSIPFRCWPAWSAAASPPATARPPAPQTSGQGQDVAIVGVGGGRHVGATGRGQRGRPLHLRHRPSGMEARSGA